ncbi:B3GT5 galactosyltransferase, partial [Chauna torquata]|nr:B3GT5 galactosyltransferase [Chauna torquata]
VSPSGCGEHPPFLLLLVPSAPSHSAQRQAVRETWGGVGQAGGLPTRTLFGLGVPVGAAERAAVLAEARRHGDVL